MLRQNKLEDGGTLVCVWARETAENEEGNCSLLKVEPLPALNRIHLHSQMKFYDLHFDKVFHAILSHKDMYEASAKPVVQKVLDGANGGVLRYGQTESENSFLVYEGHGPCQCGLAVRAFEDILAKKETGDKVEISFVQLYKDQVYDLLAATSRLSIFKRTFSRRRSKSLDMLVDDSQMMDLLEPSFKQVDVPDMDSFLKVLKSGQATRATAANLAHTSVANTHAILTFTIKKKRDPEMVRPESTKLAATRVHLTTRARGFYDSKVVSSRLYVVDLGSAEQSDVEEPLEIVALGKCLKAKVENISSPAAVQESKLTKVMSPIFDEPACLCVVITIDTADSKEAETFRLLQFGRQGMLTDVVTELTENLIPIGEEQEMVIGDMEDEVVQKSGPQREYEIVDSSLLSSSSSASSKFLFDLEGENKSGELKHKALALETQVETAAEGGSKQEEMMEGLRKKVETSKKKHRIHKLQVKEMEEQVKAAREQATKYRKLWEAAKQQLENARVEASGSVSEKIVMKRQVEYSLRELAKNLKEAQVNAAVLMNSRELGKEDNAIKIKQVEMELAQEKRKRIQAESLLADYMAIRKKVSKGLATYSSDSAAEQIEQLELEILKLRRMVNENTARDPSKEEQNKELQELVHKFLVPDRDPVRNVESSMPNSQVA